MNREKGITKMVMDIRTQLKEGMKIKPLGTFSSDHDPEYTLVRSSDDGELYGYFQKDIIKLSEIQEDKYICTGLDALEERREYLEIKINPKKTELLDHRDNILSSIEEAIDNAYSDNEGWSEIEARLIMRTREEYLKSIYGEKFISLVLRDKIKDIYDKSPEIGENVRRAE